MATLNRNILIVEDDTDIRETEKEVLESDGYQVDVASNGVEALEVLRHSHPALIMLDLMMPCMNGWQFMEKEREILKKEGIPVIVTTAGDTAVPADVAGGVSNPFSNASLHETVHSLTQR
jgi:CheY-like chemotaxis protein